MRRTAGEFLVVDREHYGDRARLQAHSRPSCSPSHLNTTDRSRSVSVAQASRSSATVGHVVKATVEEQAGHRRRSFCLSVSPGIDREEHCSPGPDHAQVRQLTAVLLKAN